MDHFIPPQKVAEQKNSVTGWKTGGLFLFYQTAFKLVKSTTNSLESKLCGCFSNLMILANYFCKAERMAMTKIVLYHTINI